MLLHPGNLGKMNILKLARKEIKNWKTESIFKFKFLLQYLISYGTIRRDFRIVYIMSCYGNWPH